MRTTPPSPGGTASRWARSLRSNRSCSAPPWGPTAPPTWSAPCAMPWPPPATWTSRSSSGSRSSPPPEPRPDLRGASQMQHTLTLSDGDICVRLLEPDQDAAVLRELVDDEICAGMSAPLPRDDRSEEHTSELQSRGHLVCRLLL